MDDRTAREYYTTVAAYHDLVEESWHQQMFRSDLLTRYISPTDLVIDIAGGTGANVEILEIAPERYVCCDLSLTGLEIAQKKGRGAQIVGDSALLPVKDSSVDVVLCSWSLEHLMRPQQVFFEMIRVLLPGGRVMIWGPNWDNIFRKDFPQFAHRSMLERELVRWKIFFKMIRNEFFPFRYAPYVTDNVAAFVHPDRYISQDFDAVHCVLCQETVKWFRQHGGRIVFLADFGDMTRYVHNSWFIRTIRGVLRPLVRAIRRIPLLRWFVIRFPLVVEIP